MRGLLIDHNDSFTANLLWWFRECFEMDCLSYDEITKEKLETFNYNFIVLSAGPKSPTDYPASIEILHRESIAPDFKPTPIIGICLGMQMMVLAEGGQVESYRPVMHGKTSLLTFASRLEPANPSSLKIARYHSLECKPTESFKVIATSEDDQRVMWVEHRTLPWLGWQFHPESFLTDNSELLLNYLQSWLKSKLRFKNQGSD